MRTKFFIDSNVLVYTLGQDLPKAERSIAIVRSSPCISVQVLNEFTNVARRKLKLEWAVVKIGLLHAVEFCDVTPNTLAIHELAIEIAENNKLKIYDANIVAAAELSGCDILYTEDLSHGQRIGNVRIQNPFMVE